MTQRHNAKPKLITNNLILKPMSQPSNPARATLRIVPHPDASMRTFVTTEDRRDATGRITRPKGTRMFRYIVDGSAEEMARYKVARGQYYLQDTNETTKDAHGNEIRNPYFGSVIYNSREQYLAPRALIFTMKGDVRVADDAYEIRMEAILRKAERFGAGVLRHSEAKVAELLFAELEGRVVTPSLISNNAQPVAQPQNVSALDAVMQGADAIEDPAEANSTPLDEE